MKNEIRSWAIAGAAAGMVLAVALMCVAPAACETLTLTFDELPNTPCGESWTMSGVTLRLLPLSIGCSTWHTISGWYLGSACLEMDLTVLAGLRSVSLEIVNYAEIGEAYVFLMDTTVPVRTVASRVSGSVEWLTCNAIDDGVTRLRLFQPRGLLLQAVFEHDGVSLESSVWGRIKALYR